VGDGQVVAIRGGGMFSSAVLFSCQNTVLSGLLEEGFPSLEDLFEGWECGVFDYWCVVSVVDTIIVFSIEYNILITF